MIEKYHFSGISLSNTTNRNFEKYDKIFFFYFNQKILTFELNTILLFCTYDIYNHIIALQVFGMI